MRTGILRVPAPRVRGALPTAQVLRAYARPLSRGVCAGGICVGNKRYDMRTDLTYFPVIIMLMDAGGKPWCLYEFGLGVAIAISHLRVVSKRVLW